MNFSETISGILDFSVTIYPFSSSAHIFISSKVTGKTFPTIFNTSLLFIIAFVKSLFTWHIARKYISEKDNPFNFPASNS